MRHNSLFSQVSDTAFHNNLVGKLRRCRLNEWTVRWMENSLSCESTPGGDVSRLFLAVPNNRTKGRWKRMHRKEKYLYCAGDQALKQIAQRDCGVFSLEIFKNQLDTILSMTILLE